MGISFERFLGIHDDALMVRSKRTELIAANMANADTPGYKAKDLDFRQALSQAQEKQDQFKLSTTNDKHIDGKGFSMNPNVKFRHGFQPSVDGNTVDTNLEKAQFAENALQYSASLRFLDGKFSAMKKVLKAR